MCKVTCDNSILLSKFKKASGRSDADFCLFTGKHAVMRFYESHMLFSHIIAKVNVSTLLSLFLHQTPSTLVSVQALIKDQK